VKKSGIGISLAFLVMAAGIGVCSLFAKDRTFSENENRYLETAPVFSVRNFLSGDYQKKLETYLQDQIWLRDGWITVKTAVQKACGDTDIGGAYVGKDGYDFEKILPEDVDDALVGRNIRAVTDYFAYCSELMDSARVSLLLVPTSGLVLEEKLPGNAILFDQRAYIDRIAGAVAAAGGYNFISPEEALRAHADEGVYYCTDHHWTTHGAFLAYQVWCEQTGHVFAGADSYAVTQVSDSFRGSLYSKILDYDSAYDTIEVMERTSGAEDYTVIADGMALDGIYREEFLEKKDKYAYFFGGNYGEVQIQKETGCSGGGSLLVIKDSFANAFVPFLIPDYDSIYMVDLRYYSGDMASYIEENGITDVLVLYSVSGFISDKTLYKLGKTNGASLQNHSAPAT
jgi:hypothetical protein